MSSHLTKYHLSSQQVEEALRKSESLFRATIDNLPLGLNVKDLDGRYMLVNETMAKRYGIPREDFIDKTDDELFPDAKESNEAAKAQELKLIRTKKITRREQKKTFDDGTIHTLLIDKFPIFDDTGELASIGVTGVDITELKQAQEKNESLAAAIMSLDEHFSLYDRDDRLVVCNEKAQQFNNKIAHTLVTGAKFLDRMRALAESGLMPEAVGREEEWIAERMERHRNPGEPFELARQDGQQLMVHEQRLADGSTVTIARNITVLKRVETVLRESEERFRSVVNHQSDAITIIDADSQFRLVNREACRSLGYDEDELLRLHVPDIADGIDAKEFKVIWDIVQGGETLVLESRHRRKDGTDFPVEVMLGKFEIKGEPMLMASARDITDRQQIERALRKSQEQDRQHLSQLEKVLRASTVAEMASALAHQLNQPISAVANYSRGFLRRFEAGKWTEDELKATLEKIIEQSDRAANIARNIADFIRGSESEPSNQDINDLVISAAHFLKPELDNQQVELELDLSDETLRTRVVPIEIEQAILNLAMNSIDALKAKKRGKRKLTLRTTIDGNDLLRVSVMDTGGGIPSEIQTRLFEPFLSTKSDGMGMGLAISRTIVEKHGGRIWAGKNGRRGAAFHFTLPISEEAPPDAP